jgi:hypothetical protein
VPVDSTLVPSPQQPEEVAMTQLATATTDITIATDRRAWRWAGGLALAHLVLMLGALSQEKAILEHGASLARVQEVYGGVALSRALGAGYVEALSFLVLAPAIVLLARLLGRRTELGRVAAQTFLGLGVAFIGSTLAVGFPPAAAAIYAAHHGVDPGSIRMVNDIRDYGFVLQVALLAGMTLALGVAAIADRVHRLWVGWGGVAVGSIGLVATPFVHNAVSMAWMIWWAGMAVLLLRGAPATVAATDTNP